MRNNELLGKAECVCAPNGRHSLEGYQRGEIYNFQICYDKWNRKYYRVFPTEETDYYETCGPIVFTFYFKEL